ncbi:bifunctional hydroxymethylpyrimidine kinase/phosphomethylpyrimidine kinase [Desertibaculum subflavum]|uniref:bifunctional hydroxymethylpyrimidine kinase/phosphomethylpyrimidine kinase n=1 Tax=Desertibaculum subflavum TaxID=2268458 RepID=UPI000E65F0A3
MKGRVLIIAGSDSGGGAGIQADIKAVTALNGFAMTAIAALTAQNTEGVFGIHAVPVDFVRLQMRLCLTDLGADCLKTGMLATAAMIEGVVAEIEANAAAVPLVVDPVMVAKGGDRLLAEDATTALIERLLPRATLITPNLPEAEVLSGLRIAGLDDMALVGRRLLDKGVQAVLMKGGHLPGPQATDVLVTPQGIERYESPRIATRHTHGTGCTLASAIATGIAQGLPLADAVRRARDYVLEAIRTAPGYGKGHGPLNHAHTVRSS